MAYKKKTTPSAEVTEIDEIVSEEIVENTKPTTKKTTTAKEKKVFTDSDYILCRSVWYGGLNITCRSGNTYEFRKYGAECEINYRDLADLVRKGSDHIFLPRFIVLDDDFLDVFPSVKRAYDSLYTTNDLIEILEMPIYRMKAEIANLPEESKIILCKMISTEIAKGRLDSISKVRALSEIFDSDFNLLSQLFVK